MAEQDRERDGVGTGLERPRRERVAEVDQGVLLLEVLLHPQEDAARRVAGPGLAVAVAEERAARVLERQPPADLVGEVGQVDDADLAFALGLLRREDPALAAHVAILDAPDLLRPAASLPANVDEVAELLRRREVAHPLIRLEVDDVLAPA